LTEILKNVLSTQKNNYPDELKEFAASLMFYSAAAYEYTRQVISGLPHPDTVRKWYRKFDFSPGISADILKSLQHKVEEYKKEGKQLQFGMQADEMHIKNVLKLMVKLRMDLSISELEYQIIQIKHFQASSSTGLYVSCIKWPFKNSCSLLFYKWSCS